MAPARPSPGWNTVKSRARNKSSRGKFVGAIVAIAIIGAAAIGYKATRPANQPAATAVDPNLYPPPHWPDKMDETPAKATASAKHGATAETRVVEAEAGAVAQQLT